MPFSKRMQTLLSGLKVAIFSSAFEQLHSMLSFPGTADTLDLGEELVWDIKVEQAVISDGPFSPLMIWVCVALSLMIDGL